MIGSHVARLFAIKSFTKVGLFSRSSTNLDQDASFVTAAAPSAVVKTYPADVTDEVSLKSALEKAVIEVGAPEVVLYNAARITPSELGQYSTEDIVMDFKIPNLGLYTTAYVVIPHLQELAKANPGAHPALYVTSGAIVHKPLAFVFSLSMAKTAQASLVKVLAEENEGKVHVAMVTVGGVVSPEEPERNPENIATKFWELYQEDKGSWSFEKRCGW